MKLVYAPRKAVFYPSTRDAIGDLPPREVRPRYLERVKALGYDAIEVPVPSADGTGEAYARGLGDELRAAGLPAACVRGGGALIHPRLGADARETVERAIRYAAWIGAPIVNTMVAPPPASFGGPEGGSRLAQEVDYERAAEHLRRLGSLARGLGITVALEVYHGSIADNSGSMLHLLDLIGLDNVGVNPDLGNITGYGDPPDETNEAAILALAPRATYWHCKGLRRIVIPGLGKVIRQRCAMPDGDIDHRFAMAAMLDAGYDGFVAVEGVREGDPLELDGRGAAYLRRLLGERGGPGPV